MADEPNELERLVALVAQRIGELLSEEGGLQSFIESGRQMKAQLEVSGRLDVGAQATGSVEFTDSIGISDSADVVLTPGPAELDLQGASPVVRVLQGASPELANDIRGRSPRDINLAVNVYMAFWTTLMGLWTLWQAFHQQPLTQTQINEIFNQTTTIVHQTINMPAVTRET